MTNDDGRKPEGAPERGRTGRTEEVCGSCSGDATIAAPRANSSTARTADCLMTLIWSSALWLF